MSGRYDPRMYGTPSSGDAAALQAGQLVRETWIAWAREQPDVAQHPSWLVPWNELPERDREVDRRIEAIIRADERENVRAAMSHVEGWMQRALDAENTLQTATAVVEAARDVVICDVTGDGDKQARYCHVHHAWVPCEGDEFRTALAAYDAACVEGGATGGDDA